jgi:hypothetical protein
MKAKATLSIGLLAGIAAYEAIKPIRRNSSKSRLLLVEGVVPKP